MFCSHSFVFISVEIEEIRRHQQANYQNGHQPIVHHSHSIALATQTIRANHCLAWKTVAFSKIELIFGVALVLICQHVIPKQSPKRMNCDLKVMLRAFGYR